MTQVIINTNAEHQRGKAMEVEENHIKTMHIHKNYTHSFTVFGKKTLQWFWRGRWSPGGSIIMGLT